MTTYNRTATLYDAIYAGKDYQSEVEIIKRLVGQHKTSPGKALLEVACGTGKHIEHLQADFEVTGVDLSHEMLAAARAKLPDVPLHQGDMRTFELGQRFDVVECLFSSIGYMTTLEDLRGAVANMARHVVPGGVLLVEPWFGPETYIVGGVHGLYVNQPEMKLARMSISQARGNVSVMAMHHLLATPAGIEHFVEHHELGMYTRDEYLAAMRDAGLEASFDDYGLDGRGLYIGVRAERQDR